MDSKDGAGGRKTPMAFKSKRKLVKSTAAPTPVAKMVQITPVEEALVEYGDVTAHLLAQGKLAGKVDDFAEMSSGGPMTSGQPSLQRVPFDDLRPEDRLELSELVTARNCVHFRKYLVCQTISFATQDVGVVSVVTDPKGDIAMSLALFSFSFGGNRAFGAKSDDILPPGSYLVVKNPGVKRTPAGLLILLCDNPAEVELISRQRMETKFPDLEWEGELGEATLRFSQKRSFWNEFNGGEIEKLKFLGKKGLEEQRFSDALRFYDMALDYCAKNRQEQATINSCKAVALRALGAYNAALKCAEVALEVDSGNEKRIYHKTQALIGLGKYEEARRFLGGKFQKFLFLSKSKECKALLEKAKLLCLRSNEGPTESQLISIRMGTLNRDEILPEFFSQLFEVSEIEGKGRGLIATQNIRPGQLLMVTRAFVSKATASTPSVSLIDKMKAKVATMLTLDPELGLAFYNLTAGAELGHLEPDDPGVGQVDMTRIVGTLAINTFGADGRRAGVGLWIAPSLLNHSCSEHNCSWDISGGWMAVRAITEIKAGDELMIAYQSPSSNCEDRQAFFKTQGFVCGCSLCQLEAKESIVVRAERETILVTLAALTPNSPPEEIQKGLEGVEKLIALRKDSAALNFPLLSTPVFRLMRILMRAGRHGDALPFLLQMFDVASASVCWHSEGITLAIYLMTCHATMGDMELTKSWVTTTKGLMMAFDGSLASMESMGSRAIELLKQKFGIDFFQEN